MKTITINIFHPKIDSDWSLTVPHKSVDEQIENIKRHCHEDKDIYTIPHSSGELYEKFVSPNLNDNGYIAEGIYAIELDGYMI